MIVLMLIPALYVAAVWHATPISSVPLIIGQLAPLALATGVWGLHSHRLGLVVAFVAGLLVDCVASGSVGPTAVCWLLVLWVVNTVRNEGVENTIRHFLLFALVLFAGQMLQHTVSSVLSGRGSDAAVVMLTTACGSMAWAVCLTLLGSLLRGWSNGNSADSAALTRADRWATGGRMKS